MLIAAFQGAAQNILDLFVVLLLLFFSGRLLLFLLLLVVFVLLLILLLMITMNLLQLRTDKKKAQVSK